MGDVNEESAPPGDASEPVENSLTAGTDQGNTPRRRGNPNFVPGVMPPVGRQWKPGESGNPAGYSKAGRLTKRLIAALEKDDGKLADALTTVILKKGLTGDFRFVQEIINRSEGRVPDRLAGHDGGPLAALPSITVIKTYTGDWPAGEPVTEEQPPPLPQLP